MKDEEVEPHGLDLTELAVPRHEIPQNSLYAISMTKV